MAHFDSVPSNMTYIKVKGQWRYLGEVDNNNNNNNNNNNKTLKERIAYHHGNLVHVLKAGTMKNY